jgi:hypothetical protein
MYNKLIIFLLFFCGTLMAQEDKSATLSGFVYDSSDGEALIGANIYFENTTIGGSTNLSGYYVIPDVPVGQQILVCEYMGYRKYRKKISIMMGADVKQNIILEEDLLETEVIVVTADSLTTIERLYEKPISTVQLSPKQIQSVPQVAEADLLRTLQTLPGVVPIYDFSSALYIRGGTPDQNLYLLDGTDVYNPEHMFGLFSTFNSDAIKHVELSKGGFGAEHGGRLSSVLDITNLDGNRQEFEGTANISLLSVKTTLQTPLGNMGSLSGSLRRTYFDKTIAPFVDEVPDYYFYDGSLKAFFDLDKNNKLTVSGYGGNDFLDFTLNPKASEQQGFQYSWGNRTGSLRWTHVFNSRLFSNFWVTYSVFDSDFDLDLYKVNERNSINDLTFKGKLEYHFSDRFASRFGFEQKMLDLDYLFEDQRMIIDLQQTGIQSAFYGILNWTPTHDWDIEMGMRFTHFKIDKLSQDWAPRFSVKYRLTDTSILRAAAGRYYQYLHRIPRLFIIDIWTISNKYQERARSDHYQFGYQKEISEDYEFEVDAFYKDYKNIYSFNHNVGADIQADAYNTDGRPVFNTMNNLFHRGDGKTYGFELLLRKDSGRVRGWLGYAYSLTEYKIDGINQNRWFMPRHDRSHTINAMGNFDLISGRNKLILGTNIVFSTGQPITEPGSAYISSPGPFETRNNVNYAPTKINNIRLPDYVRMDISLTYQINFRGWRMAPYLQVYNISNRGNVWFISYEYENGKAIIEEQYMLPLLPTIGVNFTF